MIPPLRSLIAGIFSLLPLRRLTYLQNSVQHLTSFVRSNVKMYPEPSSLLPVTPWIIFSDPPGKAVQIFSYYKFFSPLPSAVLLPYYSIQGTDFYSEFFF